MRVAVDLDDRARRPVHRRGERLRAAHAAQAGGEHERAAQRCRRSAGARSCGEASRRCPGGCPGCRCRSSEPAVIWPYIVRPLRFELAEVLPRGPAGTSIELAISTRGASAWVRNTPTGLPDCTSSVSSFSSARSAADDARRRTPSCARPCPCRRRRPGPRGRSATSGSRLFIASGARPPAASPCRRARCRAARGWARPYAAWAGCSSRCAPSKSRDVAAKSSEAPPYPPAPGRYSMTGRREITLAALAPGITLPYHPCQ